MKHVSKASILSGLATALAFVGTGVAREPADPAAVVGKPFRISDSVKKYCEASPGIMMCEQTLPLLAAMQAEPRDLKWAEPIEALIEKSMRVGDKQWIQIRALECRSIHCALEYAVHMDDLDHDVDGNEELERLMDPLSGIVVPEASCALGKPRMVSVMVWQKRSSKEP